MPRFLFTVVKAVVLTSEVVCHRRPAGPLVGSVDCRQSPWSSPRVQPASGAWQGEGCGQHTGDDVMPEGGQNGFQRADG